MYGLMQRSQVRFHRTERAQSARKLLLGLGLCLALTACKSPEEEAADYFASAQSLIKQGDVERAKIELRNVFQNLPDHREARETMARIMVDENNTPGAYTHYLRLVEANPDHVEGRTTLAEIAFEARNWQEFARHGKVAQELAPDAPRSAAIGLALEYHEAIQSDDEPAQEALAGRAKDMVADLPENSLLELILFDHYLRLGDRENALAQLEIMIARKPEQRQFYDQREVLLHQLGDQAGFEAHLRKVVEQFPDDIDAKTGLIQYLIASGAHDDAEAFLREISDPSDTDPTFFVSLVHFLNQVRGADAARAELDAALETNPEPNRLRMMRAAIDFDDGRRDAAMADLQAVIDEAETVEETPSAMTNEIKVTLARMLFGTGNKVGAQRLVEEVLEGDRSNVGALKVSAARKIELDETDSAIADLRIALDSAPGDVQALSLMADAYSRAGSHDLARDFMAQAASVSSHATGPTLRYARLLINEGSFISAEEVLLSALRRSPSNGDILATLADIYLQMEDFNRAAVAVERLRQIGSPPALVVADRLQIQIMGQRKGADEALEFLKERAFSEDAGLEDRVALLRAWLSSGEEAKALEKAKELVEEYPDIPGLRFTLAMTYAANGDMAAAKSGLRAMVDQDDSLVQAWEQLYRILKIEEDHAAANAILDEALTALPNEPSLLWAKAAEHEEAGQIDDAIAVYEDLYSRDTDSVIFANNLASLLVTYKTDEASIERAWRVARRLRDTEVPAFQDTYGWLAFRRGDARTALQYLERAANALPDDPIVHYHLAEVYSALNRPQDAMLTYEKVLQIASTEDARPQIGQAREKLAQLQDVAPSENQ